MYIVCICIEFQFFRYLLALWISLKSYDWLLYCHMTSSPKVAAFMIVGSRLAGNSMFQNSFPGFPGPTMFASFFDNDPFNNTNR